MRFLLSAVLVVVCCALARGACTAGTAKLVYQAGHNAATSSASASLVLNFNTFTSTCANTLWDVNTIAGFTVGSSPSCSAAGCGATVTASQKSTTSLCLSWSVAPTPASTCYVTCTTGFTTASSSTALSFAVNSWTTAGCTGAGSDTVTTATAAITNAGVAVTTLKSSSYSVGYAATLTFSYINTVALASSDTITFTFPAAYTVATAALSGTCTGFTGTPTVSGQTVKFTATAIVAVGTTTTCAFTGVTTPSSTGAASAVTLSVSVAAVQTAGFATGVIADYDAAAAQTFYTKTTINIGTNSTMVFTTPVALAASDTIILTFPAVYTLGTVTLTTSVTVAAGTAGTFTTFPTVSKSGQIVTITIQDTRAIGDKFTFYFGGITTTSYSAVALTGSGSYSLLSESITPNSSGAAVVAGLTAVVCALLALML